MGNDKLRDAVESIVKWCHDNDVAIFYSDLDETKLPEVEWSKTIEHDWKTFLGVVKHAKAPILVMGYVDNDVDIEAEEISVHRSKLEDEDREEFEEAITIVKKTQGQVFYLKMGFVHQNVFYTYVDFAEWADEYFDVVNAISEEEKEAEKSEAHQQTERAEMLARMINANAEFINGTNPVLRNKIAMKLLEDEAGIEEYKKRSVARRAETIYEVEMKPKVEKELKKKILDLKSKNLKKVEIASKLKISVDTVNKFYYSEED